MPNICAFELKVKGNKKSVDEFVELLKTNYHYDKDGKCDVPRHFWRVFSAEVVDEEEKESVKTINVFGECAWSVYSCMFDGPHTYQSEGYEGGTTLECESKRLKLIVEIYSEEPGCNFREHYVFDEGKLVVDEVIQYNGTFKTYFGYIENKGG